MVQYTARVENFSYGGFFNITKNFLSLSIIRKNLTFCNKPRFVLEYDNVFSSVA